MNSLLKTIAVKTAEYRSLTSLVSHLITGKGSSNNLQSDLSKISPRKLLSRNKK